MFHSSGTNPSQTLRELRMKNSRASEAHLMRAVNAPNRTRTRRRLQVSRARIATCMRRVRVHRARNTNLRCARVRACAYCARARAAERRVPRDETTRGRGPGSRGNGEHAVPSSAGPARLWPPVSRSRRQACGALDECHATRLARELP